MDTRTHALFSAGDMLQLAWNKTKENLRPLLIIGAVGAFLALLNSASSNSNNRGGLDLLNIVVQLFQVAVTMAWIRVALSIADQKPVEVPRAKDLWPDYLMFLLTTLLSGLITAVGFVLLIVPGVIIGITYAFSGFLVMDKKLDAIEAMKESARLTRGVKAELFGLGVVLLLLNFAGALAVGLGLFITVPMTFIAAAHIYRQLQEHAAHLPVETRPIAGPPAPIAH